MDQRKLKKYAALIVETALALQEGQILYLEAAVEAADFVCLVAEAALERGAGDVRVRWMSSRLDRLRLAADRCTLAAIGAEQMEADWIIDHGGALLRLESPDMTAFDGIAPERIQKRSEGERALHGGFRTRGKAQNVIACAATPQWASYLFPELPADEALDKLWSCVIGAALADAGDPALEWKRLIAETNRRREIMNTKQYTQLHIVGTGTDLYVGLHEDQFWDGGGVTNADGIFFLPNLPSYEVFTSPMASRTYGHVSSTLPLNYQGGLIRGIRLSFRDGRVTDAHADQGEALLRQILTADENSNRLGEVAIVPHGSAVQKQGITFFTTVCDENAACHLALGSGFCRQGPEEAARQDINQATLHVDFMIGSAETCIQGQRKDGGWEDILINGNWAF